MDNHLDARLLDISGARVHELVNGIAEIDAFNGWWKGREPAHAATLKHLRKQAVEISAVAAMQIGGRDRPQMEARRRWDHRGAQQQAHDAAHVTGYAELLRAVFDNHREMRFGQDLILQFHARLLQYSHADQPHRGKYKTVSDTTRSYLRRKVESPALRSADPELTPRAMAVATEWTRTRLASGEFHPLLVIAGFILEFLAIRPFVNGNGRVSRILTNFLLLQSGYACVAYASLDKVIADRWPDYYFALRQSQVNAHLPRPDITAWLAAFLDTMRLHTRHLRAVTEGRPDLSRLSENQLAVLSLIERGGDVSNRVVRAELDIPKDTTKQVLNRLLALNLIQRVGAGRAVRYRKAPVQDGGAAAR